MTQLAGALHFSSSAARGRSRASAHARSRSAHGHGLRRKHWSRRGLEKGAGFVCEALEGAEHGVLGDFCCLERCPRGRSQCDHRFDQRVVHLQLLQSYAQALAWEACIGLSAIERQAGWHAAASEPRRERLICRRCHRYACTHALKCPRSRAFSQDKRKSQSKHQVTHLSCLCPGFSPLTSLLSD